MKRKVTRPWASIFPQTDLSENLKTQKLLDAWYLLAGKNMAVLVDTVKPRLFKLFAFGKFGTMQQLLYDVEVFQEAGRSGIRAVYYEGDTKFTTLKDKQRIMEDTPSDVIDFDSRQGRVSMRGIQCYDEQMQPGGKMDLEIVQNGDGFSFSYKAPDTADRVEVEVELYPLYTDYREGPWEKSEIIDYYCFNSRYHNPKGFFREVVTNELELTDKNGRMPVINVRADGMTMELRAFCDDKRNDAHRLRLFIKGDKTGKVYFELKKNPVTVHTVPIVPANSPHFIDIACNGRPSVTVAGKGFPVKSLKRNLWRSQIKAPHGVSHLLVESADGVCDRNIAAVENIPQWVDKMGRAAAACTFSEGPLQGLVAQMVDVRRIVPKVRGAHARSERTMAYCSHNPRALMIVAAAAREKHDKKLLEKAWASVLAMVNLAHKGEDGSLLLPHGFDLDATPNSVDFTRPSDPMIAVRSILMIRSVFLEWKDLARANEALDYACRFAMVLPKMAGPNGELEAGYKYPTLECSMRWGIKGRGAVNNWVLPLWELAEIITADKPDLSKAFKDLCIKHFDILMNSTPSIMRISGGGEDGPNQSDALNTMAAFFIVKYLDSRDRKWKQYAKEAFLMASLNITILHIDRPQDFFFTFDWTESIWHDGPVNIMSKGGMHDLTSVDVGCAVYRYLGYDFARDTSAYQFLARLVDGVYENGVVLHLVTAMPNFQYRKTDITETLDFGAVGAMSFYFPRDFERMTENK